LILLIFSPSSHTLSHSHSVSSLSLSLSLTLSLLVEIRLYNGQNIIDGEPLCPTVDSASKSLKRILRDRRAVFLKGLGINNLHSKGARHLFFLYA
jgi:hypothetical protein